ncbi:hypothetical protein PR048_021215 [Dryococelus australis]|uniref:Uncharacterized protein n=1 Tax=Dryococelus australis TaxID=614101 RepID=A0ABQ9GXL7_9NEOP|nr:hypothetical protein PR048_021215 [Dryococelus australis]
MRVGHSSVSNNLPNHWIGRSSLRPGHSPRPGHMIMSCGRECRSALGMEEGRIPDAAITASSSYEYKSVGPQNARQLCRPRINTFREYVDDIPTTHVILGRTGQNLERRCDACAEANSLPAPGRDDKRASLKAERTAIMLLAYCIGPHAEDYVGSCMALRRSCPRRRRLESMRNLTPKRRNPWIARILEVGSEEEVHMHGQPVD